MTEGETKQEDEQKNKTNSDITPTHTKISNPEQEKHAYSSKQQNTRSITKLQNKWRTKKARKIFLIKIKRTRHRKAVINELIKTEESQINNLQLVVENIIKPCSCASLLTGNEIKLIFSNLESILLFNQQFCEDLVKKYENFTTYSIVADVVIKLQPFFKMQLTYWTDQDDSRKQLEHLRKNKHPFSNQLDTVEFTSDLKNLDLPSLLVCPVQRLPKQVLLFKDLLKHTNEDHPDYENIKKAYNNFEDIAKENNSKMDKFILRNLKMAELQKSFGNKSLVICDANRELIEEEVLTLLIGDMPHAVIVYFMSNLILVTETGAFQTPKLINYLSINETSFVRDLPDTKYQSNLFSIYGKGGALIFSAESALNKKKILEMCEKIIEDLKKKFEGRMNMATKGIKKSEEPKLIGIEVKVIGTCVREYGNSGSQTIQIVELRVEGFFHRLYLRQSLLAELRDKIASKFKELDPQLPKFTKNWFSGTKTKTIESRRIHIESFLQILFQNPEVLKIPEYLSILNLPKSFLSICRNTLFLSTETKSLDELIAFEIKKFDRPSGHSIMKKLTSTSMRIGSEALQNVVLKNSQIFLIDVSLTNSEKISLKITKQQKAIEACHCLASSLKLSFDLDYKLFLVTPTKEDWILDDDEIVSEVLGLSKGEDEIAKNAEESQSGFSLKDIKARLSFIPFFGSKDTEKEKERKEKSTLIFKKYLFLPQEVEELDLRADSVKLNLLVHQILDDIRNMKQQLPVHHYCLIASFQAQMKFGPWKKGLKNDPILLEKIKLAIPKEILQTRVDKQWFDMINEYWEKTTESIDKKAESNRERNESQKKINENAEILPTEKGKIVQFVIINSILREKMQGCNLFSVHVQKKKIDQFNGILLKHPVCTEYVHLAIKQEQITIMSIPDKIELLTIQQDNIINQESYPASLMLTVKNSQKIETEKENEKDFATWGLKLFKNLAAPFQKEKNENPNEIKFRFDTKKSFHIWQLLKDYQNLRNTLNGIWKPKTEQTNEISVEKVNLPEKQNYNETFNTKVNLPEDIKEPRRHCETIVPQSEKSTVVSLAEKQKKSFDDFAPVLEERNKSPEDDDIPKRKCATIQSKPKTNLIEQGSNQQVNEMKGQSTNNKSIENIQESKIQTKSENQIEINEISNANTKSIEKSLLENKETKFEIGSNNTLLENNLWEAKHEIKNKNQIEGTSITEKKK